MRPTQRPRRSIGVLLAVLLITAHTGCSTLPSGNGWGEETTLTLGRARVGGAVRRTVSDPLIFGSLATALLLQIDGMDARMSDWASSRTPVYGSRRGASRASDDLRLAAMVAYAVTALAARSGEEIREWIPNKAKGLAVGGAAASLTNVTTRLLKDETDRVRPNATDNLSFPSGHASMASVFATLAARNVDSSPAPRSVGAGAKIACQTLALACAWARVEGEHHFASDVLVGFALGRLFGSLVNATFLGPGTGARVAVAAGTRRGGGTVRLDVRY